MRKNDDQSVKTFSRRAFFVTGMQFLFLGVLGARLAWLQVVHGKRYKTLSDRNRINIKMLAPSRGQILDRFGAPLAINTQNFRVQVVPEQTDDLEKVLRRLQDLVSLSEAQIGDVLKRASKTAKFVPIEVREDLSWEEVARIEVNLPDLPGLSIDTGEVRSYPFKEMTAHVIGYVGAPSPSDVKGDKIFSLPGFKIGKTGIERSYDEEMRGKAGASEVEVNVAGREVRELSRKDAQSGKTLTLTIDAGLQQALQERLGQERSASAVILDAHTGAVYALASSPAFDPNLFTKGLPVDVWESLRSDPGHPMTNKAVAGQYPPGSTFKMITALAALDAGVINGKTTVNCPGYYMYGGDKFHCWKHSGHGDMTVVSAIEQSCDTFFYRISTDVGIDRISAMARRFGLGSRFDFDLKEESPGLMPDKDWKMGYFGQAWRPGETIVASIGQSYTQATPLQLAVMTARLVNGGKAVKPWMVYSEGEHYINQEEWPDMNIPDWHLNLVRVGMNRVVNDPHGTAYSSRMQDSSLSMGGKSGTAQVRRITKAQRDAGVNNEDLPWHYRHHALFVAYAPYKKPRYVCAVVVEHGVGGSSTAAPLARDILVEAQKRDIVSKPYHNQKDPEKKAG